jgi:hypothetical protein
MTFYLLRKKKLFLTTFIIFLSILTNQAYSSYRIDNESEIKFIIGNDVSEAFSSKAKELFLIFNVFSNYNNYLKMTTPVVSIWSCPSKEMTNVDSENNYILYEHPNLFSTRQSDASDKNLTNIANDYLYNKDRVLVTSFLSRLEPKNQGLFLLYADDITNDKKIGSIPDQPHKVYLLTKPLELFVKFRLYETKKSLSFTEEAKDITNILLNSIIKELGLPLEDDHFKDMSNEEKFINLGVYYMVARLGLIPEIVEYLYEIKSPLHLINGLKIWEKFSPEQENRSNTFEYIFDTKNSIDNGKTIMNPFKDLFNWFKNQS